MLTLNPPSDVSAQPVGDPRRAGHRIFAPILHLTLAAVPRNDCSSANEAFDRRLLVLRQHEPYALNLVGEAS
jgi:hypothetical protein